MSQKSKGVFEKGDRKCVSQTTAAHVQCPRCQHMTTWEKTPAQKQSWVFVHVCRFYAVHLLRELASSSLI